MTTSTTDYRWGVFCSAAEQLAYTFIRAIPTYKARTRKEARERAKKADRECQTPGSRHVVRRLR